MDPVNIYSMDPVLYVFSTRVAYKVVVLFSSTYINWIDFQQNTVAKLMLGSDKLCT